MADHPVKLVYFSWVRERIGLGEETQLLPDTVRTVGDLLTWLASRNEAFAAALEFPEIIRVALDQEHVEHHEEIGSAKEIALFPPMTGG